MRAGATVGMNANLMVAQAGLYFLVATDTINGCQASDEVRVADNVAYPLAEAGAQQVLNCNNSTAVLDGSASSNGADFQYSWTGPGFSSSLLSPEVAIAGTYFLTVTDITNFCSRADSVEVSLDTLAPLVDAGVDAFLSCSEIESLLDGSGSEQGAAFSYSWTDAAGQPLGDSIGLLVTAPGTYLLQITNTENGCLGMDAVIVGIDTIAPSAVAISSGVLTCTDELSTLDGTGSDTGSAINYLWSGPGLSGDSTFATAFATEPGIYTLSIVNTENGCTDFDTTEVLQNIEAPVADAGPEQSLDCLNASVNLQASVSSSGVVFMWSGPGINAGNQQLANPAVELPGLYTVIATDTINGCLSVPASVSVLDLREPPVAFAVVNDSLDCLTSSVVLDGTASAQGDSITYQWLFEGQAIAGANQDEWTAVVAGTYVLEVRNTQTGCSQTDTLSLVDNSNIPLVTVSGPAAVNCFQPLATLTETATTTGYALQWSALEGNIISSNLTEATIQVDAGGQYVVNATNLENGCTGADTVIVVEDFEVPQLALEEVYQLSCLDSILLIEPSFVQNIDELSLAWSGPDFSSAASEISVTQAGAYTLSATWLRNGCQVVVNTNVLEAEGVAGFSATVISPSCQGNSDGYIEVDSASGGTPPFLYSLNGSPFEARSSFGPLPPGNYSLMVQDSEGCEQEQQFYIAEGPPFEASLGDDIELAAGDSIRLVVSSLSTVEKLSVAGTWSPNLKLF